jgi:hypothetical protein
MTPQQRKARALARLKALGVDPSQADQESVQGFYEERRAEYIRLATEGLHFAPTHALYGMLVEALKEHYGWDYLPDDWSPAMPAWPTPVVTHPPEDNPVA